MPNDAIDTIFAELNATLDNALVPPTIEMDAAQIQSLANEWVEADKAPLPDE